MSGLPDNVCPRCRGRLLQERDIYGISRSCIACGFVREVEVTITAFAALRGSGSVAAGGVAPGREPHHGKGKRRFRL
jgi:hypothetical protein